MYTFLKKISICNAIVTKLWKIMGNYIMHMAVKKNFKISKKKFSRAFSDATFGVRIYQSVLINFLRSLTHCTGLSYLWFGKIILPNYSQRVNSGSENRISVHLPTSYFKFLFRFMYCDAYGTENWDNFTFKIAAEV